MDESPLRRSRRSLAAALLAPCLAVLLLAGCVAQPVGAASPAATAPASGSVPVSPAAAASAPPAAAPAGFVADDTLRAAGLRFEPTATGPTLLCDAGGRCICREALRCGAGGDACPDLAATLATFRAALADDGRRSGRRVDCRRAELGVCGPFRYFLFNGDIDRRELRWFDADGRLVGLRNRTDHAAWCDGRATTRLIGALPDCAPMQRTELVCGSAGPQGFSALDDLLARPPSRR